MSFPQLKSLNDQGGLECHGDKITNYMPSLWQYTFISSKVVKIDLRETVGNTCSPFVKVQSGEKISALKK